MSTDIGHGAWILTPGMDMDTGNELNMDTTVFPSMTKSNGGTLKKQQ